MKKMRKSLVILFIFIFIIISSGCSDSSVATTEPYFNNNNSILPVNVMNNQYSLLQQASDKTLKTLSSKVITADEVFQKVLVEHDLNYFVVDIRGSNDFAKGTIEGAVNIPFEYTANLKLIGSLPKDKTIIVVCYTGHQAGQTTALWNMLGYDAVAMINGMAGWTTNTVAGATLPENSYNYPVTTIASEATVYELPTYVNEEVANLDSLILAKSNNFLNSKKGVTVKAEDLIKDLNNDNSNYFVLDVRNKEDYDRGHIEGAINIPFENVAEIDNLKKLPPNKTIVIVGYYGTDANQVARVINQLGYDSYALFYGMRIWTPNEAINGIPSISTEKITDLPTVELQYEEGGEPTTASCG